MNSKLVYDLQEIDTSMFALAGGKGANLGELGRITGLHVPDGFCITTEAFAAMMSQARGLDTLLDRLALLKADEQEAIRSLAGDIRCTIETAVVPVALQKELRERITAAGEQQAWAVRSSATAEDLPAASFAGQQDSYLNITGVVAITDHVRKCWASLFTERAIVYRIRQGFEHRRVQLSVIVQHMVPATVAGMMFTADPVSGNRKVVSIDAGFGLGEALVSGKVNPDHYKVEEGRITDKKIGQKKLAVYAGPNGGIQEQELMPEKQSLQALTDDQVIQLAQLGSRIEDHFGKPQDIEWCLADGIFYIVQSRPITTLYPVPEAQDGNYHVYASVGHQQMMTDAMKPLGLSMWQMTGPRKMYEAGCRLFVDVAPELATAAGRNMLINVLGKSDPLTRDALETLMQRDHPGLALADTAAVTPAVRVNKTPAEIEAQAGDDPAAIEHFIERSKAAIAALKQNIATKSGIALLDFIREDMRQRTADVASKQTLGMIMALMQASAWLNENIATWLGEKNVADTLSQSVTGNVTSEMGLALLDVADAIRPYPEVLHYLETATDQDFMEGLQVLQGGEQAQQAITAFLDQYGMRSTGEIDITRDRWAESPATLVPVLRNNIRNFAPGESRRRFALGLKEATQKEQQLLLALKGLPEGDQKAADTKRMINLLRNLAGYREYPKYAIVSRSFVYKQALMQEARQLVAAGIIREPEDLFYLRFEELYDVIRNGRVAYDLIQQRKEWYRLCEPLVPPRIMTSEGEIIKGSYKRDDLPGGAIAGLAVSSGIVEGRARVLLDMKDARMEEGDILVTAFTDPGWTPLFVAIKGLVTEVGGLMTHGAVIAREYGLPAVVGVEQATSLIRDGQRIRVNGTDGYIELLD